MRKFKQCMALLLGAAMTISLLPSLPAAAAEEKLEVVAQYDMSHKDGYLTDISGNENHAKLQGITDGDFAEDEGNKVLNLGNKKYVELPAGMIEKEKFEIEAEFKIGADNKQNSWLFTLGSKVNSWPNVKNYLFFCPVQTGNGNDANEGNIRAGIKDTNNEVLFAQGVKADADTYNTVKVAFDNGTVSVYLNGKLVESADTGYSIQQILADGTDGKISGYIGKSLYSPDPAFTGSLKSFKVSAVRKDHTDEGKVAEAKEALTLPYNTTDKKVYGNITLPSEAGDGVAVTWETDHPEIIDLTEHKNQGYDATPAGTVKRPAKDTEVKLTATLTSGQAKDTKEFTLTVKSAPKKLTEDDYKGYFFTYFAGEGYSDGEQIYFAASKDGDKWYDLNDNKPVLTSTMGEKGVRDPFIIRSPEGDKFYMIATDLKINGGNGWGAAQTSGSQSLMVWESTDLVNWSDQRMVEVSASIDAGCTWAPEATYDPITGEYVVYWASKTASDNYGKQRLYYAKTRDFYSFTEPEVYIEKDKSSIDTTIIYNEEDGMYYRYTKNEDNDTNELGAKGKTVFAEKSSTLLGNWTPIPSESLNANRWVEGPTIFKYNKQDAPEGKWCLLVDDFGGRGYYPLVTTDLSTGEFESLTASRMPSRARHGTPIPITEKEYQAVMDKWSDLAEENNEEEKIEPVLSYDFEENDGTDIKDTSGNGNDATMSGNANVQKDTEKNSDVLYLDGSDNTFVAFPEGFFDGRNTFSISMDVKAEDVSGNYFAFAIGQDSNRYYLLKPTADSVKSVLTTSSWGGEKGFTEKINTQVQDKWLHLTLIMDGTDMKLYLDDQLVGHNENVGNEMTDLGKNLKAYLGKSFYGGDKYFKGAFDNIKVYNRVLTDAELAGGILGDKTELRKLLETYKDLDASKYTEASYQAFLEAYNAGQVVEKNPEALVDEVETAVNNLKEAIKGLIEVGDDNSENGGDGQGDGNTDNGGNGQGSGDQNTGGNSQSSGKADGQNASDGNKVGAVKTGDTANISVLVATMMGAMIVVATVLLKRKRR